MGGEGEHPPFIPTAGDFWREGQDPFISYVPKMGKTAISVLRSQGLERKTVKD